MEPALHGDHASRRSSEWRLVAQWPIALDFGPGSRRSSVTQSSDVLPSGADAALLEILYWYGEAYIAAPSGAGSLNVYCPPSPTTGTDGPPDTPSSLSESLSISWKLSPLKSSPQRRRNLLALWRRRTPT